MSAIAHRDLKFIAFCHPGLEYVGNGHSMQKIMNYGGNASKIDSNDAFYFAQAWKYAKRSIYILPSEEVHQKCARELLRPVRGSDADIEDALEKESLPIIMHQERLLRLIKHLHMKILGKHIPFMEAIPFQYRTEPKFVLNTSDSTSSLWLTQDQIGEALAEIQEQSSKRSATPIKKLSNLPEEEQKSASIPQEMLDCATIFKDPDYIPEKMINFAHKLARELQKSKKTPIEIAAFAHMRIAEILPFDQGNGRLARVLMNLVLEKYNLPTIYFKSSSKYIKAVRQGKEDEASFALFIDKKVQKAMRRASMSLFSISEN